MENTHGMSKSLFLDCRLTALYDALNPWGRCEDFYVTLAGSKPCRILDVGCGTGRLACRLAEFGHWVTGVEPSGQMLERASSRPGGNRVEWIRGRATNVVVDGAFDLIIMTGHVFQVFLTDQEIMDVLKHLRGCLLPGGALAFETRNKSMREWEEWTPEATKEVLQVTGIGSVEVHNNIVSASGELVTYETHFKFGTSDVVVASDTLRFVGANQLDGCLVSAGFADITRFGDWDRSEFTAHSPELVIIAKQTTIP